jgi:protein TonB
VALHAALLSVRFIDPEGFNRVFQDTPLEVILVNAKSSERPDKAQAIAQANMAGGGEADKGRATSPLPYSALTAVGDDFEESQRGWTPCKSSKPSCWPSCANNWPACPSPIRASPAKAAARPPKKKNAASS